MGTTAESAAWYHADVRLGPHTGNCFDNGQVQGDTDDS
jgi:hypothetical protein